MAMTITATQGGSASGGMAVAVKVLTAAATPRPGATAGNTNLTQSQFGVSITPQATGSLVYGAFLGFTSADWAPFSAATAPFIQDASGAALEYVALRSAGLTAAGVPVTLGCSSGTHNGVSLSLCEITAATPLTEDPSAPPPSGFVSGTSYTTPPFTPPGSSLLVVMVSANGGGSVTTMSVTDSTGLTWTERVRQNAPGDGYSGVWTAPVPMIIGALTATAAAQGSLTAASASGFLTAATAPGQGAAAGLQDQRGALIFDQAGGNIA